MNQKTAVEVRKFKDYEIKLKLAEAIAKGDRSLNEMLTEFKVPERTFYRWKKHPEFQQVWEKAKNYSNTLITADSAEPKSIDEFKSYNMKVVGAKKGQRSVESGIKFLQDMEQIIIDPSRCPLAARQFINYALEQDRSGQIKNKYPDKDDDSIDACRYALEGDMPKPAQQRIPQFGPGFGSTQAGLRT